MYFPRLLCLLAVLGSNACAFSLLGPYEPWMTTNLSYRQPGDIGGPMQPVASYRWNLTTITYGFDQSFLDYFGDEGVRAVEEAIAILNDLPRMSKIDLNSYPTNSTAYPNFEAQALGLYDLKSYSLKLLLHQLGLAEPSRFVWALRSHRIISNTNQYTVTIRNFDPLELRPIDTVNSTRYLYEVVDNGRMADAVEVSVDPFDAGWSAVADNNLFQGQFHAGLTRDDVGGLRWLLGTNHVAVERLPVPISLAETNAASAFPWAPPFTNPPPAKPSPVVTVARPGVDKLNLVRMSLDSNLQRFLTLTNVFVDTYFTNSQRRQQTLQRIITQPDILFRARDLGGYFNYGPYEPGKFSYSFVPRLFAQSDTSRWINHDDINGNSIIGGPGVIPPGATIDFGTTGRYAGLGNPILAAPYHWGSFDGSTNPPVTFLGSEGATSATISSRINNQGEGSVFEWTVLGTYEAVYRIDSTTDFANWSPVTTITNVDGHFVFKEPVTAPRRFYRAVRQ